MPADLRTRLRQEAATPRRAIDVDALFTSALRRRRVRRAALAALALPAAALLAFGISTWVLPGSDVLELAQSPDGPTANSGVVHRGALPDGTRFAVHGSDAREEVTGINAVITVDLGDGAPVPLGVTTFERAHEGGRATPSGPFWDAGVLHLPADAWAVEVRVYEEVLQALGPDAEAWLVDRIAVSVDRDAGMPVLTLRPPLSFADDDEVPSSMEVMYETFTVRRGCEETERATCSGDGCVQVIPLAELVAPAPPTPAGHLTVTGACSPG